MNIFKGHMGFMFEHLANNAFLTSSHMVNYVSFPGKGEDLRVALMTSIVMKAKENLRLKAIWHNGL